MQLDSLTLMATGAFVAAVSGLLLVGAWTQIRTAPALLWWAASALVNAVGIAILAAGLSGGHVALIATGSVIGCFSPALAWAGIRRFNGRRIPPVLLAGPLLALVPGMFPFSNPDVAGIVTTFAIWAAYLLAVAVELWRGAGEQFSARWPLIALFSLHAFVFLGGLAEALAGNLEPNAIPPLMSWFGVIHFEGLLYSMGTAIFMVVLAKERSDIHYRHAAHVDAMTGAANRAALLDQAERLLQRCRGDGAPFSVILFDLDRFKAVNDSLGHRAGDDVLRIFADTARHILRPNDLLGRFGGEEFVVILPSATIEVAYVIAERVRHTFASRAALWEGTPLNATVSAGAAMAGAESSVESTLDAADRALYRAKNAGRNRVERANERNDDGDGGDNVIRVA